MSIKRDNFYLYVDRDGKMPSLSYRKQDTPHHPYYVRYVNNKPVAYHGPADILCGDVTKSRVWDYSRNEFVPIETIESE